MRKMLDLKARAIGLLAIAGALIFAFQNFTEFEKPSGEHFDPEKRYTYVTADLDSNGVRDIAMFDRAASTLSVRLFGEFFKGHIYAGIDQVKCSSLARSTYRQNPDKAQPNLDYCNDSVIRPEENWGSPPIRNSNGSISIDRGRFFWKHAESLLIWSNNQIIFASASKVADSINLRPEIPLRFKFQFSQVDILDSRFCESLSSVPSEFNNCSMDRWRNVQKRWRDLSIVDINNDEIDDLVGLVDTNDLTGIWSLQSGKSSSGKDIYIPQLLATVPSLMGKSKFLVAKFDATTSTALFLSTKEIKHVSFSCDTRSSNRICTKLTEGPSTTANLHRIFGDSRLSMDNEAVGKFLHSSSQSLRVRVKSEASAFAYDYLLHQKSDKTFALSRWYCPWQASELDSKTANEACLLSTKPTEPLWRSATRTLVINPASCGSDPARCREKIQAYLDEPSIRTVILTEGVYPIKGGLKLSTLNPQGQHTKLTKRLIGLNATLVASPEFYRPDGTEDDPPSSASDREKERKRFDKCRPARDYDSSDDEMAFVRSQFPDATTDWHKRYLKIEARSSGKVTDQCATIMTEGSNITVSGLTIDTSGNADAAARLNRKRNFHSIMVGTLASAHARPRYNSAGKYTGVLPLHRVNDSSLAPDENVTLTDLKLVNVASVGIYTAANPVSVRNILIEDLSCSPANSSAGYTDGDCIALNGSNPYAWPYDSSYRLYAPFAPDNVHGITLRKGPHENSYCELKGNSEVLRLASITDFLVEGCKIYGGFSGGPAVWLYTQDTSSKLDATLRNVEVIKDLNLEPLSNGRPLGKYITSQHPLVPLTLDPSTQKPLYRPLSVVNSPLISIVGRGIARNEPIDRLEFHGRETFTDNIKQNAIHRFEQSRYLFAITPSEVVIDGLKSTIRNGNFANELDEKYRYHIAEHKGLSGKFVCRNCEFSGGARAYSAEYADSFIITSTCQTEDAPTESRKSCGKVTHARTLPLSVRYTQGFSENGDAITFREPLFGPSVAMGTQYEFINVSMRNMTSGGANAIVIRPGDYISKSTPPIVISGGTGINKKISLPSP